MKTIESLGIFWTFETNNEKWQDEVNGVIFYGYWKFGFDPENLKNIDSLADTWSNAEVEVRSTVWEGISNCNLSVEVRIRRWPEENWNVCIEKSLKWFIQQEADIAWCGTEHSSPSLDVFDIDHSSGGIYAAYSNETGYLCNSSLFDEYIELKDDDIVKLRHVLDR